MTKIKTAVEALEAVAAKIEEVKSRLQDYPADSSDGWDGDGDSDEFFRREMGDDGLLTKLVGIGLCL